MHDIERLYMHENKTLKQVAQDLSIPINKVRYYLVKNKIKKERKTKWFNTVLTDLTDQEIYTLGFLWADGYLSSNNHNLCIQIVETDYNLLKETFFTCGTWNIFHKKTKIDKNKVTRKSNFTITICDTEFIKTLCSYDFHLKSGANQDKILSIIPKEKHYLFFRGFSDGDGNFYYNKVSQYTIGSVYNQDWSTISNLFYSIGIKKYSINRIINKKGHKSSVIRITNKYDILTLTSYLYKDQCSIGLQRKIDTANKIIQSIKNKRANSLIYRGNNLYF